MNNLITKLKKTIEIFYYERRKECEKNLLLKFRLRSNSDFMILNAWMSVLRNVYISSNVNSSECFII